MSRVVAALAMVAALGVPIAAEACPCGGGVETVGAWTSSDEPWGIFLAQTGRIETGSWDSAGRFHGEPSNVHAIDGTAMLVAAVRPWSRLELSGTFGVAGAWIDEPGVRSTTAGTTDATARARYELVPEPRGGVDGFASGAWLTVRAPTGTGALATAGSTSGFIGAFGLGTWEVAYGLDLRRVFAERWRPFVSGEFALRVPDQTDLGARALGPRMGAAAGVDYLIADRAALSGWVSYGWEDDVRIDGQMVPRSWQQRTSIVLAATFRTAFGLRTAIAAAADLPFDGVGRNGASTFRVTVTFGYAPRPCAGACDMHEHSVAFRDRPERARALQSSAF